MNTDSTFQIGKDHIICEDYALSGITDKNVAYAIVSDGCSASSGVDIGARILSLSARELIVGNDDLFDYEEFGNLAIWKSFSIVESFPSMSKEVLDATLLISVVKNKLMTTYIYGDGVFIHKSKNKIRTVHVDFSHNAPSYLSYSLDKHRKEKYIMWPGTKWITDSDLSSPKAVTPFEPVIITSPVEDGDVITLCSDGIGSFYNASGSVINWMNMIDEYSGFKNTEGVFVERRMSALKRKCQKEGMTHSDDISNSSIIV